MFLWFVVWFLDDAWLVSNSDIVSKCCHNGSSGTPCSFQRPHDVLSTSIWRLLLSRQSTERKNKKETSRALYCSDFYVAIYKHPYHIHPSTHTSINFMSQYSKKTPCQPFVRLFLNTTYRQSHMAPNSKNTSMTIRWWNSMYENYPPFFSGCSYHFHLATYSYIYIRRQYVTQYLSLKRFIQNDRSFCFF